MSVPKACKRLAEVDFPLAEVSRHAAREKSIRHGHPSTLHIWWARRPLAACRAVLLGLLLPDPCDPHCPEGFKERARALLERIQTVGPSDEALRRSLLKFIAAFADWDLAAHPAYSEVSRGLVRAAYPDEPPVVVDPFAGGGSIPLEALRLGCETFASDLNPVACLILKVLLEEIPRHGPELAEELRRVGAQVKQQAERELAQLYPRDADGARPIAYLWARTVRCEAPGCGAEIPLVRSFWLARKANRHRALRYRVVRGEQSRPQVEFEVFEPRSEREVPAGTASRARATCLGCGAVLSPERMRAQLAAQRGGADVVFDGAGRRVGGARLLAVVTERPGERERSYRLPTETDYEAVYRAQRWLADMLEEWERDGRQSLCPVPDELLPPIGTLGFRVQRYGMRQWGDLFTARQKVALVTLARAVRDRSLCTSESAQQLLVLATSRFIDDFSSLTRWMDRGTPAPTFTRHALPILWDFCEPWPFDDASWSYSGSVDWVARCVDALKLSKAGLAQSSDAAEHPLLDETAHVWFTDPPYYDAVPYADLSDFFYVWLKRILTDHPLVRDPFDPTNPLTPKKREIVQDETKRDNGRTKERVWFEERMARAFAEARRVLREDGIGAVVFAHKTTEGWEALLSGMIRAGWIITGSWPVTTERPGRPRSHECAALATSVHLICRPRPDDAPVGDWVEVLHELPRRVGAWMERLQQEGVRGADLVFACIGPSLEVFSRYRKVETPEGREVALPEFLEHVWEVVGRAALEQILGSAEARAGSRAVGVLEADARLTALFLWTLQSSNGDTPHGGDPDEADDEDEEEEEGGGQPRKPRGLTLVFDVVRRFAQPLGIRLPDWEGRIIETKKGVVRLLPVRERARQLFGRDGAEAVAARIEQDPGRPLQLTLFDSPDEPAAAPRRVRWSGLGMGEDGLTARRSTTTLDRVHTAMLLQASGHTHALRILLRAELEHGPDFLRLANALSALYPRGSEEKRLLDGMLLALPR